MNEEKAIQYIMEFYRVSREVACEFYWDEVEAYMNLMNDIKLTGARAYAFRVQTIGR